MRIGMGSLLLGFALSVSVDLQADVVVSSQPLAQLLRYPELSAPAEVESLNSSRLSAQVDGRIEAIAVRVGDRVEAGDLLVQLDCREHFAQRNAQRAIRNQFQSQIKLAESQLKRSQGLRSRNSISDERVETDETHLNVLRAQFASQLEKLAQAELMVERCQILAPFAGVVRQRLAGEGELARIGSGLLVLQQLDQLEVVAALRPEQFHDLPESIDFAYLQQRYPLRLRRQLPLVDSRTGSQQIRLEFVSAAAPPGASGHIRWRTVQGHLPAHLLVSRDGSLGVMLLDSDQRSARFLPLPGAIEGQALLLTGQQLQALKLDSNSRVIVDGRQALNNGDSVQVND